MYSYFSYDVNTYVATKLDTWMPASPTATEAATTVNESSNASHDADSPVDSRPASGHVLHGSTSSSEESTVSSGKVGICDSPQDDSTSESSSAQRKPPNKSISSFTVENILMKRQRSSSSSDSPTTTTGSFLTPPPSNGNSGLSTLSNNHSSVVGTNWVSHPPVKYTKFTMLSPTSMADESQRKKRTDGVIELQWREQGGRETGQTSTSSSSLSSDQGHDLKRTPSNLRGSLVDLSTTFPVAQKPKSFSRSSSSGTPSSFFHKGNVSSDPPAKAFPTSQNVFQTATKISTLPVVQAVPTATDVKTAVLHQTFPSSGQQVVLLIPSNSTSIAGSLPTVFYTNPVLSLGQTTGSPSPGSTIGGGTTRHVAAVSASPHIVHNTSASTGGTPQPKEERVSIPSSHLHRHTVIDRAATPPHDQPDSYRPIAPKTVAELASRDSHDSKNNDKMKLYLKRTMPKPPKLRFHMTTVMKQPTGNTVMTSLTAQSPQAISSESASVSAGSEHGPLSATAASENERHLRSDVAVESTITRSPNIYSDESSTGVHKQRVTAAAAPPWTGQETDSSGSSPASAHGSPNTNRANCMTTVSGNSGSSSINNGSVSSSAMAQTTVLKDSGFHLQLVKQQGGGGVVGGDTSNQPQQNFKDQEASGEFHLVQKGVRQNGRQQSGPGRGRGRATRSYTRRKRELTFHLYEDPSTAFRAKRQCRDKEPQH